MAKDHNLSYFGEKNHGKNSMKKIHRKKHPKRQSGGDFSKTFPEGYSKKSYEKRWRNLKKGFAETPVQAIEREKQMKT